MIKIKKFLINLQKKPLKMKTMGKNIFFFNKLKLLFSKGYNALQKLLKNLLKSVWWTNKSVSIGIWYSFFKEHCVGYQWELWNFVW